MLDSTCSLVLPATVSTRDLYERRILWLTSAVAITITAPSVTPNIIVAVRNLCLAYRIAP